MHGLRRNRHLPSARLTACALAGVAALVGASAALAAGPAFGVSEDATKYADDGGVALFAKMRELGMTENRITVYWNANDPTTVQEEDFLDRMMPVVRRSRIRTVFSVQPQQALAFAVDQKTRVALFAGYLQTLARRYPAVKDYAIGNEPNERLFLQPQHAADGTIASGAMYEAILAAAYDALKAIDPAIQIAGLALSPDGNDGAPGSDNESVSPVRFIAAVGDAYRASGRTAPLMDFLDLHVYAGKNNWSLVKPRRWPNAGGADLARIKQAFWDAFNDTGQPLFSEPGLPVDTRAVRFRLDETATQVAIDPTKVSPALYSGKENVPTVDEATQASYYAQLIARVKCDPNVASLLLFHLVDESSLQRFQSGLLRRDSSERPAFAAVREAVADAKRCPATVEWRHATRVVGAKAVFDLGPKSSRVRIFGLTATAREDALAKAGIFRVDDISPRLAELRSALTTGGAPRAVLTVDKLIKGNRAPRFEFRGTLRPGRYVYAIWMRAALNPSRTSLFRSGVFEIS